MPCILLVAGEASGDLHGANLARALQVLNPQVTLVGAGGNQMQAAGVQLVPGMKRVDAVGAPGPAHLWKGLLNFVKMRHLLRHETFDAVVFIDNPGMNLRLARIAARAGHRVIYYIAPQVWAWGWRRIRLMKQVIKHLIVILPF